MSLRLVLDASPIILLTKIDALEVLGKLAAQLLVPHSVRAEVEAGDAGGFDRFVAALKPVIALDGKVPPEISSWDLGAGESQVLRLALLRPEFEPVLDDLEARRCAAALGLPVTGTLGLILRAKKAGLIEAARPLVESLSSRGARLDPMLVAEALRRVEE